MVAAFTSLFLGGIDRLLTLMPESFLELGLRKEDCTKAGLNQSTISLDSKRKIPWIYCLTGIHPGFFKSKSDYVKQPIPESAFGGIYDKFSEAEGQSAFIALIPYGGKMNEISESEIAFPRRAGNIYKILYVVAWGEDGTWQRYIKWIRKLYRYMTPYVSKHPREAYLNYKDLDIGKNNQGHISYKQASIWGKKIFQEQL